MGENLGLEGVWRKEVLGSSEWDREETVEEEEEVVKD